MKDFVKTVIRNFSKQYRQQTLPEDLHKQVTNLFYKEKKKYSWRRFRNHTVQSALALALTFILAVNLFPGVGEAASVLPGFDKLVQLVTLQTLTAKKEDSQIAIDVPKIETATPTEVANTLNKKYLKEAQAEFQQVKKQFFDGSRVSVTGDFEKVVDDSRFLVVKRTLTQIQGSSATTTQYDTIDKKLNVVVSLPLIFKNEDYLSIISEEIKQQMNEQMQADPNQIYWSKAADQPTDVQPFNQIKPNQTFYINAKHQLTITFAQGKVAPYYMGTPEFVIPTKIIQQQLASPNYLS
ncbi:RsiV family protein [Candidatus Enterococcus courvalinii]|uniref:DUF3298 domain-containing protein n=1 Tax=Candidatus Enterococcus courvalinii TaxID=2815329 RepID=A0ABS3I280_9ENTE|nr:RsiV family protein [Enterococcus sp. MSG2901]MBO0482819.1 DUF3298 domain-containing protein [Enterococcus sp. MSG2901]